MKRMIIYFSPKCLEYGQRGHPESAARVKNTYNLLASKDYEIRIPQPCHETDLLLAHDREHVARVKKGALHDADTPNLPGIYEYSRLAVGSAIDAMETALNDQDTFSLMRPPGHHTGIYGPALGTVSLGFCYFNNIAIACKKALDARDVHKIAIIDIDCHHGNGTQEIMLGDNRTIVISLHRFGFFYPGTGGQSEANCLNYPLNSHIGEEEYLSTLTRALTHVVQFNPDLIGISAGFDTYKRDPVGGLGLNIESYNKIGKRLKQLNNRMFIILEGGYGRDFPECVSQFLLGLK
jgi:acetoin utilization deacetylase AcuC-like enzyme